MKTKKLVSKRVEPKKKVGKENYVKLVGLLTLAKSLWTQIEDIERVAAEILQQKKEYGGYGHVSDAVIGAHEWSVDKLLVLSHGAIDPQRKKM